MNSPDRRVAPLDDYPHRSVPLHSVVTTAGPMPLAIDQYDVVIRISPTHVNEFACIVEGYENIATVTTLDAKDALLHVRGPWENARTIDAILEALNLDYPLLRLTDNRSNADINPNKSTSP